MLNNVFNIVTDIGHSGIGLWRGKAAFRFSWLNVVAGMVYHLSYSQNKTNSAVVSLNPNDTADYDYQNW